jgi:hypothetical protein
MDLYFQMTFASAGTQKWLSFRLQTKDQLYGKYVTLWQRSSDGTCKYMIHTELDAQETEEALEDEWDEWIKFATGAVPLAGQYIEGAVTHETWGEFVVRYTAERKRVECA